MPIYEHKCKKCGEVKTSMNMLELKCHCGGTLRRVWNNLTINVPSNFNKQIFDPSEGRYISSGDIKQIEKAEGKHYLSNTEIAQECTKNRARNEKETIERQDKELKTKLQEIARS